ncbi:PAS domain S-box protein [Methanosarcina sp. KYL-1]|uniref:PocR ligand-binding domain-containing protein n=1 Tax=Methanosarcina sp. KYL-1 TaxID=2602068 RepID=UPI00210166F1|nr:PocR ligand-binding domain-containing protein [Methanosarcina sp. KYL-1]MCQ1535023.1 PAS domain S-box protein [Methanosarcina sp. KYL-1]
MRENFRKSGIDIIGDVPWGTHFCQFYQTKEDLMDILIPYFKAGLENNEFCMWVTSQPLEVEAAKEALRKVAPGIDFYLDRGQFEIIPYTHWYVKDGIFDSEGVLNGWVEKLNQALCNGYDGLRLAGNTFWLEEKNWNNFVQYEEEVDGVIGNYRMLALCTYSLDRCNVSEIIDVVNNHQFALIKKEGEWEQIESPRQKRAEEALRLSEQRVRLKLESIISPAGGMAHMELADIIDARAIQSLMDDFYEFAHITIALVDLKGNILVSIGWQDICTRFHRVHPETCKHCVESDTKLSAGVAPGEFKLYKCKNNMWDLATPIIVDGQHVGNLFSGQFFFEGETPDYGFFRAQARKHGFNEEKYIAALGKVPRLSREVVDTGMAFLTKLAHMISQLSYSNIRLTQSLAERDILVDALKEEEEKYRNLMETANEGIWILEWTIDAEARTTYVNEKMAEMLGCSREAMIGKSVKDFTDEEGRAILEINMKKRQQGINESHEFKLLRKDGLPLWALVNSKALFDKDGKFIGSISMHTDITERKEAEAKLKEAYENLEKLVEERTIQLGKAYHSLKESEKGLAEAQKMAHIGNWEWDIAADKAYWSEEMYRIFGRDPNKLAPAYNEYLCYIHPDDRDYYCNAIKKAVTGSSFGIDYRIVLANGEERTVHLKSEFICNEENAPVRIKGIVQDITERKKAENALVNLETTRKKEIHHRIKNNLQVISSLLDLQAEKFRGRECVEDSEVLKAFRESQDRVMSIALIHEELHEGKGNGTLNFSPYLKRLADNLFQTYKLGNADTSLNLYLDENIFFDMDTAVPLGIIINELVSNSFKHAFQGRDKGVIRIKLCREENTECTDIQGTNNILGSKKEGCIYTNFILTVSDNGIGMPENFNSENSDTLGIQLVSILVDQLDGELELKMGCGTEFLIRFTVTEKQ